MGSQILFSEILLRCVAILSDSTLRLSWKFTPTQSEAKRSKEKQEQKPKRSRINSLVEIMIGGQFQGRRTMAGGRYAEAAVTI